MKHLSFQTSPEFGDRIPQIRRRILRWYAAHKRRFLWRDIDDPYIVLVSEIMLQQTQTSRIEEKLPEWLKKFPHIDALASASRRDVLLAWSGIGYNRRALHLHQAAQIISEKFDGNIPSEPEILQTLPGFGKYTAAAVACFGFRKRVPVVDVNIRRILSRLVSPMETEADKLPEADIWLYAEACLPMRAFYNWNQALMDIGATICTATAPHCTTCPVQSLCASAKGMQPAPKRPTSQERSIPRRIYRGKVIELLRSIPGKHESTFDAIGATLVEGFSEEQYPWLVDILDTLVRDGMIQITRNGKLLTSVKNIHRWKTIRIQLAQ